MKNEIIILFSKKLHWDHNNRVYHCTIIVISDVWIENFNFNLWKVEKWPEVYTFILIFWQVPVAQPAAKKINIAKWLFHKQLSAKIS